MDLRPWLRCAVVLAALAPGWLLRTVTIPLLAAWLVSLLLLPLRERLQSRVGAGAAAAVCVVAP